jgi:predicted alpha/beta hydrolase
MLTTTQIPTDDGSMVAASLWRSKGAPENVVIIQSTTGVRRSYYRAFAEFLYRRGLTT